MLLLEEKQIDLNHLWICRESGRRAGHSPEKLKVGLHSLGYVAENSKKAVEDYFPGYAKTFTKIGKERGWPPVTLDRFKDQNGPIRSTDDWKCK